MRRRVFIIDYPKFVKSLTNAQLEQAVSAFWPSQADWEKEIFAKRNFQLGSAIRAEYSKRTEVI